MTDFRGYLPDRVLHCPYGLSRPSEDLNQEVQLRDCFYLVAYEHFLVIRD